MSCLIKDENAFRASIQTDNRVWQTVKELIEENAVPFRKDQRTIFNHPAVILHHGSNRAHAPEPREETW